MIQIRNRNAELPAECGAGVRCERTEFDGMQAVDHFPGAVGLLLLNDDLLHGRREIMHRKQ